MGSQLQHKARQRSDDDMGGQQARRALRQRRGVFRFAFWAVLAVTAVAPLAAGVAASLPEQPARAADREGPASGDVQSPHTSDVRRRATAVRTQPTSGSRMTASLRPSAQVAGCEHMSIDQCAQDCSCQVVNCGCNLDCLHANTTQSQRCVPLGACDDIDCCSPPDGCERLCEYDMPACGGGHGCGVFGHSNPCGMHDDEDACCGDCVWCESQSCCVPGQPNPDGGGGFVPALGYSCDRAGVMHNQCEPLPPLKGCHDLCAIGVVFGLSVVFCLIGVVVWRYTRKKRSLAAAACGCCFCACCPRACMRPAVRLSRPGQSSRSLAGQSSSLLSRPDKVHSGRYSVRSTGSRSTAGESRYVGLPDRDRDRRSVDRAK